jgi:predicted acetyltransferase
MQLVRPGMEHLPGYVAALERGWSAGRADNPQQWIDEELGRIRADAGQFLALQDDVDAKGPPINMSDGTTVPRLPGFHRWLWDGEFCGLIGMRWQRGTHDLPEYVLGHVGYSVVPWKQRLGYATRALAMILREAPGELSYVELTTDPDNHASQKVITANGGVFVGEFIKSKHHGGKPGFRYRIDLRA